MHAIKVQVTHLHYEATQCGTRQDLGVPPQQPLARKPKPQTVTDYLEWADHGFCHL